MPGGRWRRQLSDQSAVKRSLWDALHDATVVEVTCDPMARRASMLDSKTMSGGD